MYEELPLPSLSTLVFRYLAPGSRILAALIAGLSTACQPTVRLMPVPTVFASGEHSPFPAKPAVEKSNRVEVFYATNRLPVGPRGARVHTILPGQTLYAGTARLRIGPQEDNWEALYEQSTSASGPRPTIMLESLDELASLRETELPDSLDADARRFFDAVNRALAQSLNKDLTIYVHGSNSTVELAAAQAAQFRHFSGHTEVVLVFIWPSAGSGLRYFTDVQNARQSVPVFNRLCTLLSRHTRAEHLNLLAYSAGAQIVSPGLAAAARQPRSGQDGLARLGEVYLAAPDIAFPSFVAQLPLYIDRARRVTVSANFNDAALGLSRWLHGVSRLGNPNPTELSEPASRWLMDAAAHLSFDLIAVKPEGIPGLGRRSHAFWYEHPWVSSDVLMKFLFHLPPEARGLERNRTAGGFPYWTFPPDYDRRVVDLKRRLRSERTLAAPTRNANEAGKGDPAPP